MKDVILRGDVVPVVRARTCETCTYYRAKSSIFGVCRYGGPAATMTQDRDDVCGNHRKGQIPLPGITPTPLPKGDLQ